MQDFNLSGRVALVSGGSRGIGRAVAESLATAGVKVVAFSRSSSEGEETFGTGLIVSKAADSTQPEQVQRVVDWTVERFGRLDIVVSNSAAVPYYGPMLEAEMTDWDSFFDANLRSVFVLSKLAVKAWLGTNGGTIINISSVGGLRSGAAPNMGLYGLTKSALNYFTKQLARELGPQHIRVNGIAPGLIKTEFSRTLWETPQILEPMMAGNPIGRIGEVEDIANAVTFLASDAASYITGEVLVVDGGSFA